MSDVVNTAPATQPSAEPTGTDPKATNTAPVKEKIKVDGAEEEWSPEELKKWAQIGRSKEKRFEDTAKSRKEAEAIKSRFKDDPWGAMKELGLDPRKASEAYLLEQLQEEILSPEERKQRDLERKLKSYEDKEKESSTKAEAEKQAAEVQKWAVQLDLDVSAALNASAVPKSPGSVRRVAKVLYDALEDGIDMSAEEAVQIVEDEYREDLKELLALSKDSSKFLPEDLAKRLMGDHLAKVKGAPQNSKAGTPAPKSKEPTKTISSSDFMKRIIKS